MRIAVTRLEEKSEGTHDLFSRYGHEVVLIPTLKVAPVHDPSSLIDLCSKVASGDVDYLLFSSTIGVQCFLASCSGIHEGIVIIAVGPKTAEAIQDQGFDCETIASFSSDQFASHLRGRINEKTVGIVKPDVPNPGLVSSLTSLGASIIEGIAYRLIPSGRDFKAALKEVDAVIFTSSKSFSLAYVDAGDLCDKIVIAIGPKTASSMCKKGIIPHIVGNGTIEDCLRKIVPFTPGI